MAEATPRRRTAWRSRPAGVVDRDMRTRVPQEPERPHRIDPKTTGQGDRTSPGPAPADAGACRTARYADAVIVCAREDEAKRLTAVLPARFASTNGARTTDTGRSTTAEQALAAASGALRVLRDDRKLRGPGSLLSRDPRPMASLAGPTLPAWASQLDRLQRPAEAPSTTSPAYRGLDLRSEAMIRSAGSVGGPGRQRPGSTRPHCERRRAGSGRSCQSCRRARRVPGRPGMRRRQRHDAVRLRSRPGGRDLPAIEPVA